MNIREIFVNNLKKLMILNSKSQSDLVDDLNLSQSTISDWMRAINYPRAETIQRLADYFGVNIIDLVGEDKGGNVTSSAVRVNIFSRLISGVANYNMEDVVGVVDVPSRLGKNGELVALRVKGDYMSPKIDSGDVVIIQLQKDVLNGDVVVFTVGSDDAIIRKVLVSEYGMTFIAVNQSYEPMFFSLTDMKSARIKIIGKVIEARRKF